MTAPSSRRTAARCLALGLCLASTAGCARNGLPKSGVTAQQELQEALAAARAAESRLPERGPAEGVSEESRVAENLLRGHREAEAGRLDQAARFYERVLREDPANPVAHHRLAVIADQNRDFPEAERHYSAALEERPHDPDVLNDLGYCYLLQGRYPESERALRDAVAVAPTHERSLTNLGLLYGTIGDFDRAFAVLRLTGSEAEARAKLAMLTPRPGAAPAPGGPLPTAPAGADAVVTAGATEPSRASAGPMNGQPVQSDAMRDLMDQMEMAKRESLAARNAEAAAPPRLPGLIDPEERTPTGDRLGEPPQAGLAQPYHRSGRHPYAAARPTSPIDDGLGYGDRVVPPEAAVERAGGAASLPAISGELPLWSPPTASMPPAYPFRHSADFAAAAGRLPVDPGTRQHNAVQYASAEADSPAPGAPREARFANLDGAAAQLPPPAYAADRPRRYPDYGRPAPTPPSAPLQASPSDDPGLRAYADDLARRDAEVAEMHRYMQSMRRPDAAGAAGYSQ